MTMMALIKDSVVVGLATGDSLGELIPAGVSVSVGWRFEGGKFVEPLELPVSLEQMAAVERDWRDAAVSSTEWLVTRHRDEQDLQRETTLSVEQFAELLIYRQALRDWPQSAEFPQIEHRPVAPTWVSEQTE